jgi:hypothetical protein
MKDLIEKIIGYMPQYATDFGRLLLGPNNFIEQRNSDSDNDFADALLFVALSLCLATIMSSPALPEEKDVWCSLASRGTRLFLGLFLVAISLRISWFLVGGTATIRRFVTSYAYLSGPFIVLMTAIELFGAGVFKVLDPELYQQLREAAAHCGHCLRVCGTVVGTRHIWLFSFLDG